MSEEEEKNEFILANDEEPIQDNGGTFEISGSFSSSGNVEKNDVLDSSSTTNEKTNSLKEEENAAPDKTPLLVSQANIENEIIIHNDVQITTSQPTVTIYQNNDNTNVYTNIGNEENNMNDTVIPLTQQSIPISTKLELSDFGCIESPTRRNNYSSSSSSSSPRNESENPNQTTPRNHSRQKHQRNSTISPAFITDNENLSLKNEGDLKKGDEVTCLPLKRQFPPEDIEEAFENLMKYHTLPSEEMSEPLMNYLNRKRIDALCQSDYDLAEEMDNAVNLVAQGESDNIKRRVEEDRKNMLNQKQESLKAQYKERSFYWKEKIADCQKNADLKIGWLEDRQAKEIGEFKALWQSPEYIRQFNRPSNRLLQLRHVEKKLAIMRDYEGAKRTKKIADSLQNQEEKSMQAFIEQKMNSDFAKLREKHKTEVGKVEEFYNNMETEIRVKMTKDLDYLHNGLKAMEVRKETPMTKRQFVHLRRITVNGSEKPPPTSTIPTPRTLVRYTQYRVEKTGELNLSPLDEDRMSRLPSTPVRRKRRAQSSARSSRFPKL